VSVPVNERKANAANAVKIIALAGVRPTH